MSGFFRIFVLDMSKMMPYNYNYELMKHINDDIQMTDVWRLPAIASWKKTSMKHPTQKSLGLLSRIIMASTKPGAWILDPFAGSSTTGIAANLLGRRYLGIEKEEEFAKISKARREEIENGKTFATYKRKIPDIVKAEDTQTDFLTCNEPIIKQLPFLENEFFITGNDVLMYAIGSASRKSTEPVGKIAIGIKDGMLDDVIISHIDYIIFHYWNNDKATPHKIISTPKLVRKQDIPDGFMLRMRKEAQRFLLIEYDADISADIGSFNIMKVQKKGKGRYLPFITKLDEIKVL